MLNIIKMRFVASNSMGYHVQKGAVPNCTSKVERELGSHVEEKVNGAQIPDESVFLLEYLPVGAAVFRFVYTRIDYLSEIQKVFVVFTV